MTSEPFTRPLACWDPVSRILITHDGDDVRVVENVAGHDVQRTVPLVVAPELQAEINQLREDLASTRADPFGPTAQYRGGPFCSNNACPCAEPNLPCGDWAGNAETGAFCLCCGWNEAAHRLADEGRRRRTRARLKQRPVVAVVYRVTAGPLYGMWDVGIGTHGHRQYRTHRAAVRAAHRLALGEARIQETAA